jgi:hypothetical protein
MLLWGIAGWMWKKRVEVSPLIFVSNWRSFSYDFNNFEIT